MTLVKPAIRVALIFLVISALWMLFFDTLLPSALDLQWTAWVLTASRWLFIVFAALLLYVLISREIGQMQQSLANSAHDHHVLKDALDSVTEGIVLFDSQRRFVLCNDSFRRAIEPYTDLLKPGVTFNDIILDLDRNGYWVEEDRADARRRIGDLMDHAAAGSVWAYQTADGRKIESHVYTTGDKNFFFVRTDVTVEQQMLENLRSSEERFRLVYECAPVAFVVWDSECRITAWNKRAEEIFGWPADEALGRNFVDLMIPDDLEWEINAVINALMSAKINNHSINENLTKDGRRILCEWNNGILTGKEGDIVGVISLALDITDRRRQEQELEQSRDNLRELAAQLIATEDRERRQVATFLHDEIGQALAILGMKFDSLKIALDEPRNADEFNQEIDKIGQLLEQTVENTQSATFDLSPPILYELGLSPAIEWVAEKTVGDQGMAFRLKESPGFPRPPQDMAAFLFRACRELIVNVIKHAQATKLAVRLYCVDGFYGISVEDDGSGFDPALLSMGGEVHSFGLYSLRERLAYLGGHINIASAPGEGTTVVLEVPTAKLSREEEAAT